MTKKVSMPYIGLPPFLLSTQKMAGGILSCQCPISGFPHFYCFFSWSKNSWICVSMPYIGLPPFLLYPFKNPLKSMVSGAVFRG